MVPVVSVACELGGIFWNILLGSDHRSLVFTAGHCLNFRAAIFAIFPKGDAPHPGSLSQVDYRALFRKSGIPNYQVNEFSKGDYTDRSEAFRVSMRIVTPEGTLTY